MRRVTFFGAGVSNMELFKWNLFSRQHGFAITALHSWIWERLMNNVIWLVGQSLLFLPYLDSWASGNLLLSVG